MQIDQNAPLNAKKDIEIAAPIEQVWSLLTDIAAWPTWQPDITHARLEGNLSAGATFLWKAKGLNITSTIQELEPKMKVGWTGKSIGMSAIHRWTFEPQGSYTHVTTEESLSGWFPALLKIFDPQFLTKSLSTSLQTLKNEAEKP
jgi:uncharacterized protein YndB with AHSA1/START domain